MNRWFFFVAIGLLFSLKYWGGLLPLNLGFEVRDIWVKGCHRTSVSDFLWALNIKKGDHMWQESLSTIKKRMESLPWIKRAIVARRLPHRFEIIIQEKIPKALWQNKGKKYVLDQEGRIIPNASAEKFSSLLLLTGDKAPSYFQDLLFHLAHFSPRSHLKAASFLRSYRWNLYFKGDILVKLPESDLSQAFYHLKELWPFLKASVIDLRFPDALIFEPSPL